MGGGVEIELYAFLTSALNGGEVVSFTHRPPYLGGKEPMVLTG